MTFFIRYLLTTFIATVLMNATLPLHGEDATPTLQIPHNQDSGQYLKIIGEQLALIRSKNIDKAYTDFASLEFKKNTSLPQFKKFVDNFTVLSDNKSFQYNSMNSQNSIITIEGTLISNGSDTLRVEFDLTQENGQWKILGIQLFKPEAASIRNL